MKSLRLSKNLVSQVLVSVYLIGYLIMNFDRFLDGYLAVWGLILGF